MVVTKEMRELVKHSFESNGLHGIADQVDIVFNPRLISAFGRAHLRKNKIDISSKLWERATEQERKEVVVHEACHLVVFHKYKDCRRRPSAHGFEWKSAMMIAGVSPKRTHKIENKDLKRSVKRFEAKCECSDHWITGGKKDKINRGIRYICRKCHKQIILTGQCKRT